MIKLFDRKNKISEEDFAQQAAEIFGPEQADVGAKKVAKLLRIKSISDVPSEVRKLPVIAELKLLFSYLAAAGVGNARFDVTLMRGLDYYTGMVFEVMDNAPENNRSMFGGGRYDGLVGLFGVEPVATVGMAPGLTPMQLFLETHGLLPELPSTTDLGMIVLSRDALPGALQVAQRLREEGVAVDVDITGRKVDKQLKAMLKKQLPYLLFVGETEIGSGRYTLKNTATEQEETLSLERIVSRIRDRRHRDTSPPDELDELLDLG